MEYTKDKGAFYIRIDKGEYVMDKIEEVCLRENIRAGYFQGIGACDSASILTYIPDKNGFAEHTVSGMLEMASLTGNVSAAGDGILIHGHAVFSYLTPGGAPAVTGGHLKDARVSYTGEIILNKADKKIEKIADAETGIDIWKLS